MKRYRILNIDFDSRSHTLSVDIKESWDPVVKKLHYENRKKIENAYIKEFGILNWEQKIENIKELGSSPVSILAFHNKFLRQIRNSFIFGSYYPALTGASALGERILNYLILVLKEEYKSTNEYKKVYKFTSSINWDFMINILDKWNVLLPDVVSNFKRLRDIRHKEAIHFKIGLESRDRETAMRAIKILSEIIQRQFAFFGKQPWFIEKTKGSFYIKKEWEDTPFIRKVYLPNCVFVGPCHHLNTKWQIIDDYPYENREVSDFEFVSLMERFNKEGKI